MTARVRRILLAGIMGGLLACLVALVVGCAPKGSLTDWPERERHYRRFCEIEVRRGAIREGAYAACVHRLTAHRGEPCTHATQGGE